jgi:hypothetical protein
MKIQIETRSYNDRRYGKPYIATIDFTADPRGVATWGTWVGSPGEDGLLIIDAEPGDILMIGQKDFRGRNSAPEYRQVLPDGSRSEVMTKAAAFKAAAQKAEVAV